MHLSATVERGNWQSNAHECNYPYLLDDSAQPKWLFNQKATRNTVAKVKYHGAPNMKMQDMKLAQKWQTFVAVNRLSRFNILESFYNARRRRIQVDHPNLFTNPGHLKHVTTEYMHNMNWLTNGVASNTQRKRYM